MQGCNTEFPSNKIYMQINFMFVFQKNKSDRVLFTHVFMKKTDHIK